MNEPTNDYEALVLALTLSITAPTEEKSKQCVGMAEQLATKLSEIEVERAKREAVEKADKMECEI